MDEDKASRFISSLVKSIQALCNGFVDFSTSIEVIGHIHLNIDRSVKLDYVLTEEVSKSASEGSTVFSSHSYHSQAPHSVSSKSASDTANHGQKLRKDNEADPLGLSALTREVPNTHKLDSHSQSSNRGSDSSKLSHTFSGSIGFPRNSDSELVKHERSSCLVEDSSNKRRKMGPLSQLTPSSAAKRNRPNDFGSGSRTVVKDSGFDVIEIKEEPDEDVPAVFFGSSGSGQDIQTPDFSNVVMESLDRVNQLEQSTDLVGDSGEGMGGPQQPVFPVMFHQSDGMTSSSGGPVPGPSSDTQSVASTSGDAPELSRQAVSAEGDRPTSPSTASTQGLLTTPTATTPPITAPTPTPLNPVSPIHTPPATINPIATTPLDAVTPTNTNPASAPTPTSSAAAVPASSSHTQTPFIIPTRAHISIPPLSPKYKPEDLPPDTKPEDIARLTERHILERVPPTEKKKYPSKRCKVCLRRSGYGPGPARKHPKESVYYCPQCPSKPGLCCYPCYYVYHSKLNFWETDEDEEQAGGGGGAGGGGLGGRSYPDSGGRGYGVAGSSGMDHGLHRIPPHPTTMMSSTYSGASALAQAAHAIGRAMQLDSSALYGSGAMIDVDDEEHEQKFCPMPMYGESLYGPGGQ